MIKPHCPVCLVEMQREDRVKMDSMFHSISHAECFNYEDEFILDEGTFEEIAVKYPEYCEEFLSV
ncbi:hypothetical protein [Bacillus sp. 1NLA3E]|uniref:hypothetical protein n=1 Tax=Bacillus sp. 1NLA3E TaxID=666686 RepID=UPI000247F41F|nr:hypothetical protein [Bacillus sp. 1NLA3E]AGK52052.1 hypothetical protein B1NLA3E_01340 [Bacillus sp. 1NLA3E]